MIEVDGVIVCVHCNCMAGLGETCTYIAAILFYLETVAHLQGVKTVTESECSWIIPSCLKSAQYFPINDINFTSARGLKRKLDGTISSPQSESILSTVTEIVASTCAVESTIDELNLLFKYISLQGTSSAVLSLAPSYSDKFVPKSTVGFPEPLSSLYRAECSELCHDELLDVCQKVSLNIMPPIAKSIEAATI